MFMPQIKPKYFSDVPFVEAAKWIVTGFFFKLDVANNLNALAGLSPVTGMEIVANRSQLPGLILIEVNVFSRATDIALVEGSCAGPLASI